MVFLIIFCSVGAAVLAQYCNKKLTGTEPVEEILIKMFFGCAFLSWIMALFLFQFNFNFYAAAIGFIGFLAMWSFTGGIKIGLTQTILLVPATSIVAVLLSSIFLAEWRFFDPSNLDGFLLLISSIGILGSTIFFATSRQQELTIRRQWVALAVPYVLISGLVSFLIKYFAVQQMSPTSFLVSWYSGAFLGSLLPFLIKGKLGIKIARDKLFLYLFSILATFVAMAASFWALILAPAALVLPLHSFLFVAGTVLVALFVFHEGKSFGWWERAGFATGLLSSILLLIGGYW